MKYGGIVGKSNLIRIAVIEVVRIRVVTETRNMWRRQYIDSGG